MKEVTITILCPETEEEDGQLGALSGANKAYLPKVEQYVREGDSVALGIEVSSGNYYHIHGTVSSKGLSSRALSEDEVANFLEGRDS